MLFFEIGFLVRFLVPLVAAVAILKIFRANAVLPWVASIASLVFLGAYNQLSVVVALTSITLNYVAARYLLGHRRKPVLVAVVAVNLLILGYFKYSFFASGVAGGLGNEWTWRFALPLGVSFYTFQQIAFIADVYRGKITSFDFRTYALFKLFFPQFIAGPIVHYERVRASYERWPRFNSRSIRFGLSILILGFAKKLIGDYFGDIANPLFSQQSELTMFEAWASMLAFSLQIYFDFSGYSDMAVGLARLFGVSLPFNFDSPYKSKSMVEFWRRWHITLSNWLRDYLYITMGGNRRGAAVMYTALFFTMVLGGLWHGAGWTFVAWGALHGIALIWCRLVRVPVVPAISIALTFFFVSLTWILFRSDSLGGAVHHFTTLFSAGEIGIGIELKRLLNTLIPVVPIEYAPNRPEQIGQILAFVAAGALCFTAPNSQAIALWFAARKVQNYMSAELPVLAGVLIVLSLSFISPDTISDFIYFQF